MREEEEEAEGVKPYAAVDVVMANRAPRAVLNFIVVGLLGTIDSAA